MIPAPPMSLATITTEESLGNETPTRKAIEADGRLTDNELSFILDTTLRNKHREEPSVLRFIDNYIRCKNIAQASAEAGISPKIGYQYRHAKDIALAIQKLTEKSHIKYGFDGSEIIERTKEMVDFDPIEMQNPDGTYKTNLHDISPEARRNLKKLKVRNIFSEHQDMNGVKSKIIIGEMIEYEFYDKLKAIELVGREKDLFKTTTKVEHTISDNMASILLDSAKRGAVAAGEVRKLVDIQGEVR